MDRAPADAEGSEAVALPLILQSEDGPWRFLRKAGLLT